MTAHNSSDIGPQSGTQNGQDIGQGFAAPALDSQRAFRAVMNALAEPGTVHDIEAGAARCMGLSSALTALVLTLADFETRVWIDAGADAAVAPFVRFHTGAPITTDTRAAQFALVTWPREMPRLAAFAQGNLDYPDTSTTLLIDVSEIATAQGWHLSGPGIPSTRRLSVAPLPATFAADLAANRAAFPCGVDIVFCAGTRIVALPRSTRVTDGGR